MKRILLLAVAVLVIGAGEAVVGTSAASGADITIVDTLGFATPTTRFSVFGSNGASLFGSQYVGPRFTLAQKSIITEIGAFVNNCGSIVGGVPQCPDTLPLTVQIRPSAGGVPDPSTILGTFELSHDDDPLIVSYESATPNLTLEAGEYFALFAPQQEDAGFLLAGASSPFEYRSDLVTVAFFPGSGTPPSDQFAAVRILGRVLSPTELLNELVDDVSAMRVGPGQSLVRILRAAQGTLDEGNESSTCGLLASFVREAEAQSGKSLTQMDAATFIAAASDVRTALGC